jgi:VanZ family protein
MSPQMANLRLIKLWHFIGALMILFIFYMTLTPNPVDLSWRWSDKLYHFSGYFGLMAWYAQLLKRRTIAVLLFIAMGVSLESAQLLVSARSFEWADMLANVSGVVVAALLFRGVLTRLLTLFEMRFLYRV